MYDNMNLVKGSFAIDDSKAVSGYHDPKINWNGWKCPFFARDDILAWLKSFENKVEVDEANDTIRVWFEDNGKCSVFGGIDIQTADGIKHLYPVGAWSWTWDEYEDWTCAICGKPVNGQDQPWHMDYSTFEMVHDSCLKEAGKEFCESCQEIFTIGIHDLIACSVATF